MASSPNHRSYCSNWCRWTWPRLCLNASSGAMNGAPAFRPLSASSGMLPVAAFTTACQAAKATDGTTQARSSRPGRVRPRSMPVTRTMAMAATATMTVSLVSAPYARSAAARTGRRSRTASSPASRRTAASGSAVSRDRLVIRPKNPGSSSPASACRPPRTANTPPR